MKLNNMRNISAKQLKKEVVDCKNFKNVFEMIFESIYAKFSEFKEKHHREGEFTDENGVLALATGFYLGVTLRIFSRSNTKLQPYTEHNENQPIIFNIFIDDRNVNSEHFQSLKQPEVKITKKEQEKESETKKLKTTRTTEEVMEDYLSRYYNEHETTEPVYNTTMGKNNQTNKLNGNKNQTKNEINNKFQPKTTDVKNEEAYKENTRNSNDNQKQNARTNNTEVNKYKKNLKIIKKLQ